MDFQPWNISNKKIKHEEDAASNLRLPAFQKPSLLPVVREDYSATSVANAPLPSIESPGGPSHSGQDTFRNPENEENCDPSLQHSSQSVSTTEMSGSHSANSASAAAAAQFTPLIQQNQDFNVRLHELRSEVDQIKKERDIEHQGFVKTIASLREELRAVRESTQGQVLTKASKVGTALTEYNNAACALRTGPSSVVPPNARLVNGIVNL